MNRLTVAAWVAVIVLAGCQKSEPGGRGGTDTFKIVVPALSSSVTQGEVQTVRISVERGTGFKQGIKLQVKAPAGLQVEPSSTKITAGDKGDLQLTITAAKDAPLGERTIQVEGTPDKGDTAQTEFKITVSTK